MTSLQKRLRYLVLAFLVTSSGVVVAQDRLKIAVGQGLPFDTAFPIAAVKAGIFKKYGLDIEVMTTSGGGETLQAVISGSVDVGVAAGTTGVLGAFAKGAPLRVISAEGTGSDESFLYVPYNSPIQNIRDIDGKTVAFSTVGASTYSLVSGIAARHGVKPKFVPTGSIPATYATTMSGQVDVGWGAVPFGIQERRDGKIRILAWGDDATNIRNQTLRVNIVHAKVFDERKDILKRFMVAYYEAFDWAYESQQAVKIISETAGLGEDIVEETRSKHTTRFVTQLADVKGIAQSIQDAIEFKYLSAPLTLEQQSVLFQMDAVRPPKK